MCNFCEKFLLNVFVNLSLLSSYFYFLFIRFFFFFFSYLNVSDEKLKFTIVLENW